MKIEKNSLKQEKILIRVCHQCHFVMESSFEIKQCGRCKKSFLPLQYHQKIHQRTKFEDLFATIHEIDEEDIVKGLYVIW